MPYRVSVSPAPLVWASISHCLKKKISRLWKSLFSTKDFEEGERSNLLSICCVQRANIVFGKCRREPVGLGKFHYQISPSVGMKCAHDLFICLKPLVFKNMVESWSPCISSCSLLSSSTSSWSDLCALKSLHCPAESSQWLPLLLADSTGLPGRPCRSWVGLLGPRLPPLSLSTQPSWLAGMPST